MVNSNFYGIDALVDGPTNKQTARAANLIYACLLFRKQIDRQELKPVFNKLIFSRLTLHFATVWT
jgi:carnitine O-palmitoyltransferase 1